jgi:hypothetical protein
MQQTIRNIFRLVLCIFILGLFFSHDAFAGRKKMMSIRIAKITAKRALVESVYGVKVRKEEKVTDVLNGIFVGTAESKTKGKLRGVVENEVMYDDNNDVAKVTVSIALATVTQLTGIQFPDPTRMITRVGFGTTTKESAGAIKAIRVAEVDAYSQLAEEIVGIELESKTKVENYVLKSDEIKSKLIAAIFMAELVDFGWEGDNQEDAFVVLKIDTALIGDLLGEPLVGEQVIQVKGYGSSEE